MKPIVTKSTSRSSAFCDPIVLREGDQVRLVFLPTLVDNLEYPKASVDGQFVYERRKAQGGQWHPVDTIPLSGLKAGEGYKLTLHALELRKLLEGLVPLYRLYEQNGIPSGQKTFLQVDRTVAKFVSEGHKDLAKILETNAEDAPAMLLKLVRWLATSSERRDAAQKLVSMAPEEIPTFTALIGLAAVKDALEYWKENQENSSEEFWQNTLEQRAYVLSQVFAYPVVVIGTKAYVGGKLLSNKGGKEVDILASTESTDAAILIEIKTPQTKLLGSVYRGGVFPWSRDLSGAISQALRYRQSFVRQFDSLVANSSPRLTLGEPRCIVIAGRSSELLSQDMKESFELQREHTHGVTILTFDELFLKLQWLIALLEQPL
jgi:Domain of unknown function (DUF4263)